MFLLGDAAPRIGHLHPQHPMFRVVGDLIFPFNAEGDLSLFRVFDRVADQIVEDLGDPLGIGHQLLRDGAAHGEGQLQPDPFRPVAEGVHDVADEVVEVEFAGQAGRLARGHFLEVQDVVDQAEQVAPAELHVGQMSELFFPVRVVVDQEVGEA